MRPGRAGRAAAGPLALVLLAAGCVPRTRVNASCAWREAAAALPPPGDCARRRHLLADVELAQELGVRRADSAVGRPPPSMAEWVAAEQRCTRSALDAAARHHAADRVTRAELDALVGGRDWRFDAPAVFLPIALLLTCVGSRVAAGVVAGGDGGRASALALAALTPLVGAVTLAAAGCWAGGPEMLRLRNDHISYRASQLPTSRHPWPIAAAAAALFAVQAARALRRGSAALGAGPRRGGVAPGGRRG